MVSTLTRMLGFENLHVAEDVVQDALLQAMRTWPFRGIPPNPSAWLMKAAKNRALDVVRRERNFESKQDDIMRFLDQRRDAWSGRELPQFDDEIRDDQLRMIFACCHPALPEDAQVVLTLKTLCGLNENEIAAAFLSSVSAITKRLVRARQKIRETGIDLEIPAGAELNARLDAVLQTLYLLFNEGYKASQGDRLVRTELCEEAIRLGGLLADHPIGDRPKTHALLALMLLNAARLQSRADEQGNILLLSEQDRALWSRPMIDRGITHLNRSSVGDEISDFHLQAGIAACHCSAPSHEQTDWRRIIFLYDYLIKINPSPVVALNRAVAVSNVDGAAAGLAAVESIERRDLLDNYYLLHAVLGQFHFALNHYDDAAREFRRALDLTHSTAEQAFLQRRLRDCEPAASH